VLSKIKNCKFTFLLFSVLFASNSYAYTSAGNIVGLLKKGSVMALINNMENEQGYGLLSIERICVTEEVKECREYKLKFKNKNNQIKEAVIINE
jgi:hypothetical protein